MGRVAGGRADAVGLGHVDFLTHAPDDGSIAMHTGAAPTATV
jgi:hypothetical protein